MDDLHSRDTIRRHGDQNPRSGVAVRVQEDDVAFALPVTVNHSRRSKVLVGRTIRADANAEECIVECAHQGKLGLLWSLNVVRYTSYVTVGS
jgi:hypothetical protein